MVRTPWLSFLRPMTSDHPVSDVGVVALLCWLYTTRCGCCSCAPRYRRSWMDLLDRSMESLSNHKPDKPPIMQFLVTVA